RRVETEAFEQEIGEGNEGVGRGLPELHRQLYEVRSGRRDMTWNCRSFAGVAAEDAGLPEVDLAEGDAHPLARRGGRQSDRPADERHALDPHELLADHGREGRLDRLLAEVL